MVFNNFFSRIEPNRQPMDLGQKDIDAYKIALRAVIQECLSTSDCHSTSIPTYLIHILNDLIGFLFVVALIKKMVTGTYFLSTEGACQEALQEGLQIIDSYKRLS